MKSAGPALLLRPSSAPIRIPPCKQFLRRNPNARQIRNFSNPLNLVQSLTASRILPYEAHQVYNIIADISSYPEFIPYCNSSTVTSLSSEDTIYKKKWPRTADLRISYGPYDEIFKSNVYCAPFTSLEAVSGNAEPTLPMRLIPHYNGSTTTEKALANESLFSSLLTRWSFKEFPFKPMPPNNQSPEEGNAEENPSSMRTEVSLVIEVQFANAVYSVLSQAAAPKVAGMMIEAFEKRAKQILGDGHAPISPAEEDGERSSLQGAVGGSMKM